MYVKCHIILLFGTILFVDKFGAAVHWKFLPLFRNFPGIVQFSWGSTCLAHLYRALCRHLVSTARRLIIFENPFSHKSHPLVLQMTINGEEEQRKRVSKAGN
ncbi:hypothetical protein Ahy_B07g087065 [Arachis hypogaea]|uniref:Aminotransferase-like plant mobile domain-containing protein n=1 Tax=Arachis hypogaea TaxID=3818 RepID=A0A444YBI3_ARAHY|nr:hypothetical protein Ahy_B07g087065 [Arachis hypogaea]